MKRTIHETWCTGEGEYCEFVEVLDGNTVFRPGSNYGGDAVAAAQIAAAAPEMARVLSTIAQEMNEDGTAHDVGQCCFDLQPKIVAALRKAGVLP